MKEEEEEGEKASPSCTMDQKKKGSKTSVNSKKTVDNSFAKCRHD